MNSLTDMCQKKIIFLNSLEINELSSPTIFVSYYEVLRKIIEAIAIKEGYKVYSHEAFFYFLKEKKEELIALRFDKYRKLRNGINYYGKDIDINEVIKAKEDIIKFIKILKLKYLK